MPRRPMMLREYVLFAIALAGLISVVMLLKSGHSLSGASTTASTQSGYRAKRRMQVIKAGGIPKEGLGSSLGFVLYAANLAQMLDADFIVTQTAEMMGYRASEIFNKGVELLPGGTTCDILEVLLKHPGDGTFQGRMDRAVAYLDTMYERAQAICRGESTEDLFDDYALAELRNCDTLVINDYRAKGTHHTPCTKIWWRDIINQFSGPAHGNDVAIHFRWGDMYQISQISDKWRFNMTLITPLVDIIREENPTVSVHVYMKKSKLNESDRRMREILAPLSGDFTIIEAAEDVEELSMMAKAKYLFVNSGSFSEHAAATGQATVVIENGGGVRGPINRMALKHVFNYNKVDLDEFRQAVRETL
jgi:hypothetical protein